MPVGISCKALLFCRCVPFIVYVKVYNGTTPYNIQGYTQRLPRSLSLPRNDILRFYTAAMVEGP